MESLEQSPKKKLANFFQPSSVEGINNVKLNEITALINTVLSTIDGVRVNILSPEDFQKKVSLEKGRSKSNYFIEEADANTVGEYDFFIDEKDNKSIKNSKNQEPVILINISNDNITYTDFASLILDIEKKMDDRNKKEDDSEKKKGNEMSQYYGNLLGWQSLQIEEMANAVEGNPKAKEAILEQAEEYRKFANALLEKDPNNKKFEPEFVKNSIEHQRFEFHKRQYQASKQKRKDLADYLSQPGLKRKEFKKELAELKDKLKFWENNKFNPDNLKKWKEISKDENYSSDVDRMHFLEKLLSVHPKSEKEEEQNKTKELISEIMGGQISQKTTQTLLNVILQKSIGKIETTLLKDIEEWHPDEVEKMRGIRGEYDETDDTETKADLEKEFAIIIHEIVYRPNYWKRDEQNTLLNKKNTSEDENEIKSLEEVYMNISKKIFNNPGLRFKYEKQSHTNKTGFLQTFNPANKIKEKNVKKEDIEKYKVQCITQALLISILYKKYLGKDILGGLTSEHMFGAIERSNKEIYDTDSPWRDIRFNLKKNFHQENIGYYGYNSSGAYKPKGVYLTDILNTFISSQLNNNSSRISDSKKFKESEILYTLVCEMTGYNNPIYVDSLGAVLSKQGKYSKAKKYFRIACEITGYNDPIYVDSLGVALSKQGKYSKAEEYFKMAFNLETDKNEKKAYLKNIITCLNNQENRQEEVKSWRAKLKELP